MKQFESHAKVLLVDDEPSVRDFVGRCLREHGYSVLEAANGSAALAALRSGEPIDLLLTDVMMPGVDGLELAARFKTERADTPIVLMSGYVSLDLPKDAPFLQKPFTPRALLRSVERELGLNAHRQSA